MTSKEIAKQAFLDVENEARAKQVAEIKAIVRQTLEKLDTIKKDIKKLQDKKKILELDIDDLKEGKLDRIADRQAIDPEAKKVSVVVIIKEKEVVREVGPWYWPYQVIWQEPVRFPTNGPWFETTGSINLVNNRTYDVGDFSYSMSSGQGATFGCGPTINCSVAKDAAIGAYEVSGSIVHLR